MAYTMEAVPVEGGDEQLENEEEPPTSTCGSICVLDPRRFFRPSVGHRVIDAARLLLQV
jgi:hypothetical protein